MGYSATQDAVNTPHKSDCKRAFKNYDETCPRCLELIAGAKARPGWSDQKRRFEAQSIAAIHAHFASEVHRSGKCGPVCTYGDW